MASRRFRKVDVELHSDGFSRRNAHPAVNVKVHHVGCTAADVMAKFPGCTEEQADKALQFAYDAACETFWESWGDCEADYFFPGEKIKVYSEGRSSGWLVVHGLPEIESWNAVMVNRWGKFQKAVRADVIYRMSKDAMLEDIESNEWYKPRSSRYNFADTDKGTVCLADVRADVSAYTEEKFGLTLQGVI